MGHVPGLQYDVFISYSHANNHDGWVTRFHRKLLAHLGEFVVQPKIYWDNRSLAQNDVLDEDIPKAVNATAVFLPIVSYMHLQRPWCDLERDTFLAADRTKGDARGVFIVRYDDVSAEEYGRVLPNCVGTPFFDDDGQPLDTESVAFKSRLHQLTRGIWHELERQREAATSTERSSPVMDRVGGTVFIAPVHGVEMVTLRDELASTLRDYGLEPICPDDRFFSTPGFEDALSEKVRQSDAFVQLLDEKPFPTVPGIAGSVEKWFLNLATKNGPVEVLRWRRNDPVFGDDVFRTLARETSVRTFPYTQFKTLVADTANAAHADGRREQQLANAETPLLVLQADEMDELACDQVGKLFDEYGFDLIDVPPPEDGASLNDVISDLEGGGFMLVYERTPRRQILRCIQQLRKFKDSDAARNWVMGFWNRPVERSTAVRLRSLRGVHVIEDESSSQMQAFLKAMRGH
jgi:hypothetical protein